MKYYLLLIAVLALASTGVRAEEPTSSIKHQQNANFTSIRSGSTTLIDLAGIIKSSSHLKSRPADPLGENEIVDPNPTEAGQTL
jgi:hypothetical protein